MLQYAMRRLLGVIPSILALLFIVVVMVRLIPGSIVDIMVSDSLKVEDRELGRATLRRELGLDRPLPQTYLAYVGGVARGDFGRSLWDRRSVRDQILARAPVTVEIALIAIVVSFLVAVPAGVLSAVRQDSWADYLVRTLAILGISTPSFAIGTMVVVLPALWFGWSPSQVFVPFSADPLKHLQIVLVPALVLGLYLSSSVMRMMRTTMLEAMRQDYIRTAQAKGLNERMVIVRHGIRNALIPVITVLGVQLAFLFGGSVITESIFSIPGLGRLLLSSINNRDYPMIQGIVVFVGLLVMLTNLAVDVSYGVIDPRIRYR